MPATEAVKTLASSFEGLGGATALSVIAFSVVFLVLIFLTIVIYAMRLVSRFAGSEKPAAAPAAKKAAPVAAAVAGASAAADEELVAVGVDNVSWITCGRLEGLQGALSERWN